MAETKLYKKVYELSSFDASCLWWLLQTWSHPKQHYIVWLLPHPDLSVSASRVTWFRYRAWTHSVYLFWMSQKVDLFDHPNSICSRANRLSSKLAFKGKDACLCVYPPQESNFLCVYWGTVWSTHFRDYRATFLPTERRQARVTSFCFYFGNYKVVATTVDEKSFFRRTDRGLIFVINKNHTLLFVSTNSRFISTQFSMEIST